MLRREELVGRGCGRGRSRYGTARVLATLVGRTQHEAPLLLGRDGGGFLRRDVTRLRTLRLGIDNLGLNRAAPRSSISWKGFIKEEVQTGVRRVNPEAMHHAANLARHVHHVLVLGHDMHRCNALGLGQGPHVQLCVIHELCQPCCHTEYGPETDRARSTRLEQQRWRCAACRVGSKRERLGAG